jgi:hypothetical protein
MELTTLDPLGVFYLVAGDVDWNIRPENQTQQGGSAHDPTLPSLRPTLATPPVQLYATTTFFKAVSKPNSEPDQTFMLLSWLALASPANTPLTPNTPSALVLSLLYNLS